MLSDKVFAQEYAEFMNNLIDKGYAVEVSPSDLSKREGVWYMAHHAVRHPHKDNIRVVFDCAAKYLSRSLNQELLSGPDLTNSIVGVLMRFRSEKVAFMADIEKMFYQVKVPTHQQSFLRFLWWPNSNVDLKPVDHQMTVHVFGAASSPGCANFALRHASTELTTYSSEVRETLQRNFYVDDLLKSEHSVQRAKKLVVGVNQICADRGFNLTKFVCSYKDVLTNIPSDKISSMEDKMSLMPVQPIERALGIIWHIGNDSFGFNIVMNDVPLTRRGVLSSISSIFDPLGLIGPFVLKGKRILQKIVAEEKDWDDPLSEYQISEWRRWRLSLLGLSELQIARCYRDTFAEITETTIHSFADASEEGYGACVYRRDIDIENNVHVSLVMARSRVAPMKSVTIPRLELMAADMSVKLKAMIVQELDLQEAAAQYFSDSKIVLGYIMNEKTRYRTFVANRVVTSGAYPTPLNGNM